MLKDKIRSLITSEVTLAAAQFSDGRFHCYDSEGELNCKFSNSLSSLATSTIEGNNGEGNATKAYVAKVKKELKKKGVDVNKKISRGYKVIDSIIGIGEYIENVDIIRRDNKVLIAVFNRVKDYDKYLNNETVPARLYTPEEFIEEMQQHFN